MGDIKTSIVVAVAANNVIGSDNEMPWRLATDLRRFKSITMGKPIIMGRKTHESIGSVLPGRTNIVISRRDDLQMDDVQVVPAIPLALAMAKAEAAKTGADEIMIIGGGKIYEQTMDVADRLYVTHVESMPAGDTKFPVIQAMDWRVIHQEQVEAGLKDSAATVFRIYERVSTR